LFFSTYNLLGFLICVPVQCAAAAGVLDIELQWSVPKCAQQYSLLGHIVRPSRAVASFCGTLSTCLTIDHVAGCGDVTHGWMHFSMCVVG